MRLTREHRLGQVPDDFLYLFGQFEHLAQFKRGLCGCLQHPVKEVVERKNTGFVPIVLRLGVCATHHLQDLHHRRILLPGELADDAALDLSELLADLLGHVRIQLQEDVQDSEQVEGRQAYELHHHGEGHFPLGHDAKLQLRRAYDHRLQEHGRVDQLAYL